MRYEGGFSGGSPTWTGDLDISEVELDFGGAIRKGPYTGQISNGLPEGEGHFATVNDSGKKYTYDGSWKGGRWNGYGVWEFEDPNALTYKGNFTNGTFDPSILELIDTLGSWPTIPYKLYDESILFLTDHADLFPADSVSAVAEYVDESVQYKHLSKDITPYLGTMVKITGEIYEIYVEPLGTYTISQIHLVDSDWNSFWCYYPGNVSYFNGDTVTLYALPIGPSSFSNTGGGTTVVQVLAVSLVTP